MSLKFLDDDGLEYFWTKLKSYFVPSTRTVNGKALSSNISLTASDVSAASSTHTHGDITNSGDITATATIASGDRIVINDESASKVTNSSITFGTSTSTYLRNDGTWGTPSGGGGGSSASVTTWLAGEAISFSSGTSWKDISSTTYPDNCSVTLSDAGVYILFATVAFSSNSSGRRAVRWYDVTGDSAVVRTQVVLAPANGAITYMQTMMCVEITSSTTFKIQAYQNSGSALNVTPYRSYVKITAS